MTVLVTDANERYTRVVVQSLGRKGINITVAGEKGYLNTVFYSKYCRKRLIYPQPQNEEAFINAIKKATKGYELLIPMHERTIVPISKYLKEFEGTNIPISEYKILKIALDKSITVKVAQSLGIPTPHTFFVEDLCELKSLSKQIEYPLIIKFREEIFFPPPRYVYAYSPEDLIAKYKFMHRKSSHPLIQELVEGIGYGFFTLFDRNSKPIAIFCHRRLREYPITGGPSTYCESVFEPKIINYGLKLLKKVGWYGIAMVEFRLDKKDNTFKLMEINPRFWGSLPLAIASGVNFPYLLYQMATEDYVKPQTTYKIGVKCRFLAQDLLALKQALHTSDHKISYLRDFIRSLFDRNVIYGDFSLKDFGPSAFVIAHILMSI